MQLEDDDRGAAEVSNCWRSLAVYAVLLGVLLAAMSWDFRARPIYPQLSVIHGASTEEVAAFFEGEPFVFELEAQQAGYDEIYWVNLLSAFGGEIEVVVENLTQGRVVAETVTRRGENTHFEPGNAVGDRLRISMRWLRPAAPRLLLAETPPSTAVTLTVDGKESESSPLFYFGHRADPRVEWDRSLLLYPREEFEALQVRAQDPSASVRQFDFTNRDAVTIRFSAPADDLNFIKLPGLVSEPGTRVKIVLRNETTGEVIKESMAEGGEDYERRFKPANKKGDRIAIDLQWRLPQQPRVQRAQEPAEPPIVTRVGDREVDFPLAFLLRSSWPTWHFHWLWLPAVLALLYVYFSGRRAFVFLVALGLASAATSLLMWQQTYGHDFPHIDPDSYGMYGEKLAHYVSGAEDRGELREWFRTFAHSHVVLTSALIAVGVLCGLPMTIAYLVVANLAGFGTLLLMWRLVVHKLDLGLRPSLLLVALYSCHLFVLKGYGRTSTDALGVFLVVGMLYLLIDRLKRTSQRQAWLISLLVLLHVLARPPGIVLGPFMLGMVLLCDVYRTRQLDLRQRVVSGLQLGIGPLMAVAACYLAFGWLHNQELAIEKSKTFRAYSKPEYFFYCLPALLQLFPLLWLGLAKRRLRARLWPEMALCAIWGLFFTALLIGVQAPFLLRLFLPVVPAVVLLAGPGLAWLVEKRPTAALALCLPWCAINVGIQIYNSSLEYLPPTLYIGGRAIEISRYLY